MNHLPEPPAAPAAGQAANLLTDSVMQAAVRDFLHQTSYDNPDLPSHKDGTQIGSTPPVPQPDSRIVPQWATGIAVASIGIGAGVTGLGCAAWLVLKGLALVMHSLESVTLLGVLAVAAPFAGFAMVATAIGGLISKTKKAIAPEINNHTYTGTVYQDQRNVKNTNVGAWVKNTNQP